MTEDVITHPASGITSAMVRAGLGIGSLRVSALEDTDHAFELVASYDRNQVQLTQDVRVEDGVARVRLGTTSQRVGWPSLGRSVESEWRLSLNPDIPMRLDISTGVSRAHLALDRLTLTRLTVNAGVGEVLLTLPDAGSYDVSVDGGVGALRIEVPEEVEARLRVDRGLGALEIAPRFRPDGIYHVTAGFDGADDRVEIDVDGGVGSIVIR
ncbi:MAG TPA: hypothetical protein ENN42_09375 [Thioalkalivibrio sp.]|nr:hypothetical protein [Thioalkalivibrio sp.]